MTGHVAGRPSRMRMGAVVVCALLASLLAVPPAQAEHYTDVREVAAPDGVAGAVAYSKLAFPDGSPEALLGRADVFADSLASGVLQKNAPLLLTTSSDLSQPTEDELKRLGAKTVTILGGTSAVSRAVESDLESQGYTVQRRSGATRIETAVAVARSAPKTTVALLARAAGGTEPTAAFADALAAGGWAAQTGWPVLLTQTDRLSDPTAQFLREGTDQVWVVGGRAAVGDEVIAQIRALGVDAQRVSGPNRFDTAIAVASQRGFPSAAGATEVVLVDGQGANAWTDGFAAAAYAGRNRAPIVLANSASGTLPESTLNFLKAGPSAKLLVGWTVTTAEVNAAAEAMGKEAALTRIFQVRMTGKNVVRTGSDATTPIWGDGAEDGSGLLTMTVDDEAGAVDFTFETAMDERYDKNALVLRRGGVDARGPVVFAMGEPDEDGKLSGRVVAEDFDDPAFTVAELIATPAAFYAELTPRDDDEAIRGQLPSGGEAHLPGEPTFIAIESKEGDDWVKVRFAAPVFTTATGAFGEAGGWSADDFTASVNNGVTTNVEAVRDLSANAADAVDFFYLDLAAVPTAGTVSIGLKASGAAKLLNNLGEHPNSGTHTQMTPLDTVKPEFAAIEAIGSSSSVTLLFSEAVHTTATNVTTSGANRHITVTSMAAGFSRTHDGAEPLNLAKAARTDRISLALAGDPIPAGAEVRVTINAAGAALIKDAKGNAMAGETTRSAATRGGGSLADVTATDLLINGAALQAQTVAFAVNDELPGDKQIKFDLPTGTGTPTYSAVEPGLSGWPAGTEVSRAGTTITFTLPSSGSVRDGQRLAVTLYEVASGTTSAQKIRITRTDTGAAADARFENRSGAQVTASSIVAGPPIAHSITITLRGAAVTANTVVDIDLSEFTAAGAVYGGTPSVSSATVAYVGNPKRAAQLSGMTGSTWTVTLPVTAPAGIWLPGLGLKASRSEPGVITADDRSRTTASPISVGPLSGWGSSATQQFAFRTVSPMSTSETFSFQFTRAPIMASPNNLAISYPATGSVTSANTAGNVTAARNTTTNVYTITYTPTATVPAGSLVVFSFSGVNTWDTDATSVPLSAAKRSNTNLHAASGTLPSFSVTGAPSAVLLVADFEDAPGGTDSNMFGDEPGDRIAFEFHVTGTGDPADNSTLTLRATANGVGTNHTVKCGSPSATSTDIVTCRRDPQDPKKIIVAVTKPLGTPIKVLPATPPPPAATVFDINGTAGWPGPSKAAANLIAVT